MYFSPLLKAGYCFKCLKLQNHPHEVVGTLTHFTEEKTKAERGEVTIKHRAGTQTLSYDSGVCVPILNNL